MSFTRLKNLPQTFSNLGITVIALCMYGPMVVVLKPSVIEFIVFFVVDNIFFFLFRLVADRLFLTLNPSFKAIYPDPDQLFKGESDQMALSQKNELYHSLSNFPILRALLVTLGSYVKAIPTILIVVFYWHHETSNWIQFLLLFFIMTNTYIYVFGEVYIQSHIFNSEIVRKLHQKYDFSEVFKASKIVEFKHDFEKVERTTSLALQFALLFQLWLVITSFEVSKTELAIVITLICFSTGILLVYLQNLGRSFLFGGIKDLFNMMNTLDYKSGQTSIALHTTSVLAKFEQSYNLLLERLRQSEMELSSWISSEAEKSRFQILGEMSGLIAHDLSGPLHVINFCISEMQEDPSNANNAKYINKMADNVQRAVDLINSLRAKLKDNTKSDVGTSNFGVCHQHSIRLLKTQFEQELFEKIRINLSESLNSTLLHIKQTDLIQILDNLYRNTIENLISNNIEAPAYEINLESADESQVVITFSDNGTGLTPEGFEQLTAYRFASSENVGIKSLGLKLTRRLVEMNGGSLEAVKNEGGTCMRLVLKKAIEL